MDGTVRFGTVVRALASHCFGPGLIPAPGFTCGLSLLLDLVFASGSPVFVPPEKPTL